jgi:dCMP deaminase
MNEKWLQRFMAIAANVSTWSKDPSTRVGAVIVSDDKRILATGYNGFPRGFKDSDEYLNDREFKYKNIIHAEQNAILDALYHGVSIQNSYIFVYGLPICSGCMKYLIQAGITKFVIINKDDYPQKWKDEWEESKRMIFERLESSVRNKYKIIEL